MLNLIVVLVIAFPGWLLRRAIGYVIGFRGGRPLLERTGRTQKLRLKTIDKGEKLFERFTRLGALAAPKPVSGIKKEPVPTLVFASIQALLPSRVHRGHAILCFLQGKSAPLSKLSTTRASRSSRRRGIEDA